MLSLDRPEFEFFFRFGGGTSCIISERELTTPFIVAPDSLQDWNPSRPLSIEDLAPIVALNPEVILLGTGATQTFPSVAVLKYCQQNRIGLEVMSNASAASTFNVLAGEGRQVVAAILFQS